MADFVKVATISDLPEGSSRCVEIGGASIALFNVGGRIHALGNACPHRGGPLGEGSLSGGVLTCPWHAFEFEVGSGKCLTNPNLSTPCFAVKQEGQDILVQI